MFIKLTQLDGKSIWFNSAYIVTVEPRKGSGALVVPLGDGIDYEVVESPAQIIELLGGSISPAADPHVVKGDAPSEPVAVVQADEPSFSVILNGLSNVGAPADADVSPAAKTTRKTRGRAAATAVKKAKPVADEAVRKAPSAKKTAGKAAAKKSKLPPIPLTEDQLIRLQKMSPGTLKKLVNTMMSQFGVAETEQAVDALQAREIISVTGQGHVEWNWRKVEPPAADPV